MKALSARQIEKVLIVPVPIHKASQPLKIGTFLSIVKQSGIDRSVFK